MNRLYPAETRLKEGAHAHDSEHTGGNLPLPRVGGALSARSRQYQESANTMSTAAKSRKCRSRLAEVAVVSRICASWNQLDEWLQQIEGLRAAA